jgi:sulfopyruvate decarboxylase subunit alpha
MGCKETEVRLQRCGESRQSRGRELRWYPGNPDRPGCLRLKKSDDFGQRAYTLRKAANSCKLPCAMPVSQTNSRVVYSALRSCGIRLVSALPETWLVHLIRMAEEDPEMTLVRLAKEEEGVGVSAGAHFAGVKSAMLMQNHGFLASINGIVSFAQLYRIPLLMIISYRGTFGERDPWQTQGGAATEPLLRALGIPYALLDDPEKVAQRIRDAQTWAYASLHPAALLLTRQLMWQDE